MTGGLGLPMDIPVSIDRAEAQRRALEELAKAKYGGTPAWLDALMTRLNDLLRRLEEFLIALSNGPQRVGGGISWGFVIAVLALLVAIGLVVWKVGLPKWRSRRSAAVVRLDPGLTATDYRELADQHAHHEDWRAAVRDRFRGLVAELESQTILDVRPSRTAWEAAASAARVIPDAQSELFAGAELFSRVVYSDERADESHYVEMVRVDRVVTQGAAGADLVAALDAVGPR